MKRERAEFMRIGRSLLFVLIVSLLIVIAFLIWPFLVLGDWFSSNRGEKLIEQTRTFKTKEGT